MPSAKALLPALLALGSTIAPVTAHPGEHHDVKREIELRDFQVANQARSLAKCANSLKARQVQVEAQVRRHNKFNKLRKARGLEGKPFRRRDFATDAATSHNETSSGYTTSTSASTLFGSDTACILTGEVTQGPYWVDGEYVRENVRESQAGVDVHLEMQFVDVSTCEPVAASALYVDIWNANATGVYGGVVANGNGNSADASNINATYLRGVQPTDSNGVVTFDSIVPGHYSGRTNHMHIMAHQNGSVNSNGTYSLDNTISHVGQLFFDQTLLSAVEATSPYNTNDQAVTTNTEDTIASGEGANNYDPFVKYAYLGEDITDGLLAWISVGVDMSADYSNISPASTLTSSGGVADANSMGGGPGGSGGGNGTAPSGAMGSGMPPSGSGFMPGPASTSYSISFNTASASAPVSASSASAASAGAASSSSSLSALSSSSVANSAVAASTSAATTSASTAVTASTSLAVMSTAASIIASRMTSLSSASVSAHKSSSSSSSSSSSASHPHSDPRSSSGSSAKASAKVSTKTKSSSSTCTGAKGKATQAGGQQQHGGQQHGGQQQQQHGQQQQQQQQQNGGRGW